MRCRGEIEIVYECTKYIECNVLDMATPLSAGKTQSPGPVTYVFARLESEHLVSESMHWSTTSITSISTFFVFPEEQHNMSARRRGEEMTRQELCLTYLAQDRPVVQRLGPLLHPAECNDAPQTQSHRLEPSRNCK